MNDEHLKRSEWAGIDTVFTLLGGWCASARYESVSFPEKQIQYAVVGWLPLISDNGCKRSLIRKVKIHPHLQE